ncbi:hypothetical protein [Lutibacter maritimus]|uniref:Uncharacterized protein n=1 Tax=Lutibacter maritimus TaxID=593133 RepID=A0A1I6S149_9FLAO|nr:hypothetical protein [Lutibacter maritimus]SFS70691.1 hypothetical protein SAMN04488006_2724 [Lutibacter maritimus]
MKNQVLGIFFYLLYLLAMVRPLVPIMEYYANYNYIATVLCENKDKPYLECNGKCYLQKQLKEVNHDNHEHKSTIPQINFDDYPVSPLDQYSYQLKDFKEVSFEKSYFGSYTSQDFFKSVFKPPQVIS